MEEFLPNTWYLHWPRRAAKSHWTPFHHSVRLRVVGVNVGLERHSSDNPLRRKQRTGAVNWPLEEHRKAVFPQLMAVEEAGLTRRAAGFCIFILSDTRSPNPGNCLERRQRKASHVVPYGCNAPRNSKLLQKGSSTETKNVSKQIREKRLMHKNYNTLKRKRKSPERYPWDKTRVLE